MKISGIDIPKDDNTILTIPNPNDIPEYIETNRKIFAQWNFSVGNIPVKSFREMAREEAAAISDKHTANFILQTPRPIDKNTIIMETGHQPGLCHPGVIAKYLLMEKIIDKENYAGLNLIVDSDTFKNIAADIPNREKTSVPLFKLDKPVPFESAEDLDADSLNKFLDRIEALLLTPYLERIKNNFKEWKDSLKKNPPISSNLTIVLTHMRRLFAMKDGKGNCRELPLSILSEGNSFLIFFLHIAIDAKRFHQIYNRQLSLYRKANSIRYQVYPFPDLRIEDNHIEIPFWHVKNKERQKISVKTDGETISIINNKEELVKIPADDIDRGIKIIREKGIKIRPNGLTTTMFNRMFIADLFIHGTGGAKYDIVTNEVIRDFFGAKPPLFATITMTKYPDVKIENKSTRIKELNKKLHDIDYNPDRYIDNKHPLITQKKELLIEINRENADKKRIGEQIRVVNNKLQSLLKEEIKNGKIEVRKLREEMEIYNHIKRRDYPYFFFRAESLRGLTENI